MTRRLISCALLLYAFLLTGTQVVAEVSAQLRDQIMRQAASMALPATWVHEGLRSTGFLDDPKTREIVERSPAAYALAWAALQAEEEGPGAAVQLLQNVAQGIAAHHADAIRHEPALIAYFQVFPKDRPVPPPTPRRFAFARSIEARPDIAQRLPNAAQVMIAPLAKYAYAYPGGMQGMMVEVLGIAPTDAMSIERSSPEVPRALFTAIERAPVPPPQEVHLKDVLAALLMHGGEAIRYEDAVRRFGPDVEPNPGSRRNKPLAAAREAPKNSASVEEQHALDAIAAHAGRLIASLKQDPNFDDQPLTAHSSALPSLPSTPLPGFSSEPSFNERVRQLHSEGVEAVRSVPEFTVMRAIGGGRGGGGIVMGGGIAATFQGQPIGLSFRPIQRSNLVVAVVAMSDGRVLFGPPIRPDVLIAAYRIAVGDPERRAARMPSKPTAGAILISLVARQEAPANVSEFLVHPAISDLQLGRDLIVADGAEFLFADELARRLGKVQKINVPRNSAELSVAQWRAAMAAGEFGHWYRYVERPLRVSLRQDSLIVTAMNDPDRNVLFELVRPAEPKQDRDSISVSRDSPLYSLLQQLQQQQQERSVVIRDATDALAEFGALNDFLRVSAIMRWAQDSGARWFGGLPHTAPLMDVRSVVKTAHSSTFDSRGAVDIELEKFREIVQVLPAGIPVEKQADARRLNKAIARDAEPRLFLLELSSRGYSSQVKEQAMWRLLLSKSNTTSYTNQILLDMMRREMSPSDYEQLKRACDEGSCSVYSEAVKREPWIKKVSASWEKPEAK
ncbi:MAG: hypothetical protein JWQ49_2782 [Edaphobacter sp.]|nr:hypothetical protein [Edaphobacter sp.]